MLKLAPYAKAVAAFLLAGLTALGTAAVDGKITPEEWISVGVAALATTGVVHRVPNKQL